MGPIASFFQRMLRRGKSECNRPLSINSFGLLFEQIVISEMSIGKANKSS